MINAKAAYDLLRTANNALRWNEPSEAAHMCREALAMIPAGDTRLHRQLRAVLEQCAEPPAAGPTVREHLRVVGPLGPRLWALAHPNVPRRSMPADLQTIDDDEACRRYLGPDRTQWLAAVSAPPEAPAEQPSPSRWESRIRDALHDQPAITWTLAEWGEYLGCIGARRAAEALRSTKIDGLDIRVTATHGHVVRKRRISVREAVRAELRAGPATYVQLAKRCGIARDVARYEVETLVKSGKARQASVRGLYEMIGGS